MADSIREALTSAFSAAEQEAEENFTPDPAPKQDTAVSEPVGGGEPVDNTPAPAPTRTAASSKATPATDPARPATTATTTTAAPAVTDRAPASWKAEEKAGWASIPPVARAAIQRREQETQRVLSTTASARRLEQEFNQAIQPFMPLMEHHGIAPVPAVRALLEMRAALEVGTPDQKAQLVSNLVRQFGVDITALDGYLSKSHGQAPVPAPQRVDPRSIPELAPLFSLAEQVTAAQAAKLDSAFAPIESLPHYETVRETMADLLEASALRGKALTLEKAYELAVQMDPSLAGTPSAQQRPTSTSEAAAILARSRKAASTTAGAPRTSPTVKPVDRRSQIEAAFDAAASR